jgi:hypothetical protein
VRLLKRYNTALVIADTAGKWPYREDLTSDFVYLRLHGAEELYASGYSESALQHWAKRIDAWHHGQQPGDAHLIAPRLKPGRASPAKCSAISTTTSKSARPTTRAGCSTVLSWIKHSPPPPANPLPKGC